MTPTVSMTWLGNNPKVVWERIQALKNDFVGVVLLITHNSVPVCLNYCYCNYSD